MTSLLLETNLSHDGPHRSQCDFCVSMIGRAALRCKKRDLLDLGKRKMKKISKLQHVKIAPQWTNEKRQQGCLRNSIESSPFNSNAHDLRNQLICCGAHRGKREIRDNRSVLQGRSAEEENAQKTGERERSWLVSCELPNRCPAAPMSTPRSSTQAVRRSRRPTWRKNISRRQCTHYRVLHACLHHSDLQQ